MLEKRTPKLLCRSLRLMSNTVPKFITSVQSLLWAAINPMWKYNNNNKQKTITVQAEHLYTFRAWPLNIKRNLQCHAPGFIVLVLLLNNKHFSFIVTEITGLNMSHTCVVSPWTGRWWCHAERKLHAGSLPPCLHRKRTPCFLSAYLSALGTSPYLHGHKKLE